MEIFNCERKVIIVRIKNQETVENILLNTFRFVAGRDQWTGRADVDVTFLDAGRLSEQVIVRLDFVDNNAPLSVDIDRSHRLNVSG